MFWTSSTKHSWQFWKVMAGRLCRMYFLTAAQIFHMWRAAVCWSCCLSSAAVSFPRLPAGTEKISCHSVRADKLFRFHTINTEQDTGIWSPRYEPLMAHLLLRYSFVGVLVCEHLQPLITQRLVVAETWNDICPAGTEAVSPAPLLMCSSAPWHKL